MHPDLSHGFRVGQWKIEPLKDAITGPDERQHHLQPKVMDVLVCLAETANEPVTRDGLLNRVWGERVVSDEVLTRAIGELRRALHDTRKHPEYIETIPKRGYRLLEQVVDIQPPVDTETTVAESTASADSLFIRPRLLVGMISLILISVLFATLQVIKNDQSATNATAETTAVILENTQSEHGGAQSPIGIPAAVNRQALDSLIIGQQHKVNGNLEEANKAFERAIQLQPDYPEAVFELALLELRGLNPDQRIGLEKARQRVDRALQLALRKFLRDPTAFETNLLVGRILATIAEWDQNLAWRDSAPLDTDRIRSRFAEAEIYLRAASEINNNSSSAAILLADVLDGQGRKVESLDILEKAQLSDPFNFDLNWKIALRWASLGRYQEAIQLLQRFEELPETSSFAWARQLELMQIHAYWDDKCETLIRLLQDHPDVSVSPEIRFQISSFIGDLIQLGLYDQAEAWRARAPVSDLPEWAQLYGERFYLWANDDQKELTRRTQERLATMTSDETLDAWYSLSMNWAWDLGAAGDTDRAIGLMESIQHAPALRDERDVLPPLLLAQLYFRANRDSDAKPILDRLSVQLEAEVASGVVHPESLFRLAEVYALQERHESAIHALQMAVDSHFYQPWWNLPWRTSLNGLDKDPRVASLRAQVEKDLQRQAGRIRDMLEKHDVNELLAPLTVLSD